MLILIKKCIIETPMVRDQVQTTNLRNPNPHKKLAVSGFHLYYI